MVQPIGDVSPNSPSQTVQDVVAILLALKVIQPISKITRAKVIYPEAVLDLVWGKGIKLNPRLKV